MHAHDPHKADRILGSKLTRTVLDEFARHLARMSRPEGLFEDTQVSGHVWRGQLRRVRCCLYRVYGQDHDFGKETESPKTLLNHVALTLAAGLTEAGIGVRRALGRDLYEWLQPFLNRKGYWASPGELLRNVPYPGDQSEDARGEAPIFGWDLAEFLNLQCPKSDVEHGCFEFDGVPVKALTLQRVRRNPDVGHLTAEREHPGQGHTQLFARFDRLPANSMLSITVTIRPQNLVVDHVERIRGASRALTAEAQRTHAECTTILDHIAGGDKLLPTFVVLYLSADDHQQLKRDIATVNSQLDASGLQFIKPEHDLTPLDAFIRGLPMAFDPRFDAKHMHRSRLLFRIADRGARPRLRPSSRHRAPGVPDVESRR